MKSIFLSSTVALLLAYATPSFSAYTPCPSALAEFGCSQVVLESVAYSDTGAVVGPGNDAGSLMSSAKNKFEAIRGTIVMGAMGKSLSYDDKVDTYAFSWAGGWLSIETITSSIDTMLFLFDSSGLGMAGNDDNGTNLLSRLTFDSLSAGDYFLAVTSRVPYAVAYAPVSGEDLIFPVDLVNFTVQWEPTGPGGSGAWTGWTGTDVMSSVDGGSPYAILFAVPEPGTLALLGLAGVALGWSQRRRRSRAGNRVQ